MVHPVAIRYFFRGDVERTIAPVLEEIERRLSWRPQAGLATKDRIVKLGEALLTLKEIEYQEKPQQGDISARLERLTDHILAPLEEEWLKSKREADIPGRVKALRAAILENVSDTINDLVEQSEILREKFGFE